MDMNIRSKNIGFLYNLSWIFTAPWQYFSQVGNFSNASEGSMNELSTNPSTYPSSSEMLFSIYKYMRTAES
jgi:hypothetical protein